MCGASKLQSWQSLHYAHQELCVLSGAQRFHDSNQPSGFVIVGNVAHWGKIARKIDHDLGSVSCKNYSVENGDGLSKRIIPCSWTAKWQEKVFGCQVFHRSITTFTRESGS